MWFKSKAEEIKYKYAVVYDSDKTYDLNPKIIEYESKHDTGLFVFYFGYKKTRQKDNTEHVLKINLIADELPYSLAVTIKNTYINDVRAKILKNHPQLINKDGKYCIPEDPDMVFNTGSSKAGKFIYVIVGKKELTIVKKRVECEDEFNYCTRDESTGMLDIYEKINCFNTFEDASKELFCRLQRKC